MAEAAFMPPEGQSEYAFPAGQGDEAEASQQRNQQIDQSFQGQRFQRAFIQGLMKSVSSQAQTTAHQQAQIDQAREEAKQAREAATQAR